MKDTKIHVISQPEKINTEFDDMFPGEDHSLGIFSNSSL